MKAKWALQLLSGTLLHHFLDWKMNDARLLPRMAEKTLQAKPRQPKNSCFTHSNGCRRLGILETLERDDECLQSWSQIESWVTIRTLEARVWLKMNVKYVFIQQRVGKLESVCGRRNFFYQPRPAQRFSSLHSFSCWIGRPQEHCCIQVVLVLNSLQKYSIKL